jgi:hypothetical protein
LSSVVYGCCALIGKKTNYCRKKKEEIIKESKKREIIKASKKRDETNIEEER